MNRLSIDKRTQIIRCLCDGMSIRATARICDVSFNAAVKVLRDAGRICSQYQEKAFNDLPC